MSLSTADSANAKEIDYWNGPGGRHWTERQEAQDTILHPLSAATTERATVRPGERIVDIGCGTGATTLDLAGRVGASGHVLGIDISEVMLARAAERTPQGTPVEWALADATTYPFKRQSYDLLFSRFGVMFFADPTRSFTNIRTALKSGGRVAFCCWRHPRENAWLMTPYSAALEHVPPLPKLGPEDPGPFSFSSEERVRRILVGAGFTDIALTPFTTELDVSAGRGIEEAIESALEIGPTGRAMQGQPEDVKAKVEASIRRVLAQHQRGSQVMLSAAIWIVTARNPGA